MMKHLGGAAAICALLVGTALPAAAAGSLTDRLNVMGAQMRQELATVNQQESRYAQMRASGASHAQLATLRGQIDARMNRVEGLVAAQDALIAGAGSQRRAAPANYVRATSATVAPVISHGTPTCDGVTVIVDCAPSYGHYPSYPSAVPHDPAPVITGAHQPPLPAKGLGEAHLIGGLLAVGAAAGIIALIAANDDDDNGAVATTR